jgi:large subunit ribosomal protein L13e|eukprot:TRINITY_DN79903_c0_g1_i1.p2 TRINITY_DN79903_c0_g1~~TRINITY_DN79903_c0_g1_i1.p2  ORF type:complete len:213 (-),score=53.22 TRINITY_DN79903_c0_g1_i1:53-691(-)
MVKNNNVIQKNHFRKDWQRFVKTWFDQPAKKVARRAARVAKAKAVHPRPVNALRPVVRCQTVKYNTKVRAGRGFTLAEMKAAGVIPKQAAGLGIAVDYRRKNRSQESLDMNAKRLKAYLSKLVVVTKKNKKTVELPAQVTDKIVFGLPSSTGKVEKARALTEEEKAKGVYVANMLRQSLMNQKLYGRRVRKSEKKAQSKAAELKKAAKAEAK